MPYDFEFHDVIAEFIRLYRLISYNSLDYAEEQCSCAFTLFTIIPSITQKNLCVHIIRSHNS